MDEKIINFISRLKTASFMTSLFQLLMQKQTTLGNMIMLEPDCMRDHIKGQSRGMLTVQV